MYSSSAFDALHRGVHQLAAALAAGVGRAKGHDVAGQRLAQAALEAAGGLLRQHVCSPDHGRPQHGQRQQSRQQ